MINLRYLTLSKYFFPAEAEKVEEVNEDKPSAVGEPVKPELPMEVPEEDIKTEKPEATTEKTPQIESKMEICTESKPTEPEAEETVARVSTEEVQPEPDVENKKRKRDPEESEETESKKAKTEETTVVEPLIVPEKAVLCGGDETPDEGKAPVTEEAVDMEIDNQKKVAQETKVEIAQPEDISPEPLSEPPPPPAIEEQNQQTEAPQQVQESEEQATSSQPQTEQSQTDLSDYVVIDMKDVPDSQSSEVAQSLPKEHEDSNSNNVEATIDEEVKSTEPCATVEDTAPSQMETNQNGDEPQPLSNACEPARVNSNDTASVTEKDPLVNRQLVMNPTFSGNFMTGAPFTIATYNILAECHMKRANYYWVPSQYMDITYRHKR